MIIRRALLILIALMPGLSPAIAGDRCHAIFEASRECRYPYVDGWHTKFCDRINPKEAACAAKRQAAWDAAERKADLAKPCRAPPAICGGEWVDDRTYTSHSECRTPSGFGCRTVRK